MDRIDLHIEVKPVKFNDLSDDIKAESSASIKVRVNRARDIQLKRYAKDGIYFNSQLRPKQISLYCKIGSEEKSMLKDAFEKFNLSARAFNRILKVARTIADLEGSENIRINHIAEAIQHRSLDKKYML